jgi:hypothetical protein
MKRIGGCLQAQAIGCSAVKYEEHLDVIAQLLPELCLRGMRIGVIAIADHVPLIRPADGFKYRGVHSGIVVAGEASSGFHEFNNLAEEQKEQESTHLFPAGTSKNCKFLTVAFA